MVISESLYESWKVLLQNLESLPVSVRSITSVTGGDVNKAYRICTSTGDYFVKVNTHPEAMDMFVAESNGLGLLRKAVGDAHTPQPLTIGNAHGESFLLMRWIDAQKSPTALHQEHAGRLLASLHRCHGDAFGLDHDNFIGPLRQHNDLLPNWMDFFIRQRLQKQLDLASEHLIGTDVRRKFERLFSRIGEWYDPEAPSPLHGDLWSGNYLVDQRGTPVLIDPAVYYGHREVDVAMTRLFGGFSERFYAAYHEVYPLQPGWTKRADLWNLYPLLVHLNLFGASYLPAILRSITHYI